MSIKWEMNRKGHLGSKNETNKLELPLHLIENGYTEAWLTSNGEWLTDFTTAEKRQWEINDETHRWGILAFARV